MGATVLGILYQETSMYFCQSDALLSHLNVKGYQYVEWKVTESKELKRGKSHYFTGSVILTV